MDQFQLLSEQELELYDSILTCLERGMNKSAIGRQLGLHRNTIHKYMKLFDLAKTHGMVEVDDAQLDDVVGYVIQENPLWGEKLILGYLKSQCIYVQRARLRESMKRIDAEGVDNRRRRALHRREYQVPYANYVWHIDGHHKLIKWRLVIHGGIDGYSRLPVYLKCGNNNRSITVLKCFLEAVDKYGCPDRVRSDCGGENTLVRDFMIEQHGDYGFISGRSVHNQRIERLWRDVFYSVLIQYHNLFTEMEENDILNPIDEIDLFALHYVYVPVINLHLERFIVTWNNHKIRTADNLTPLQLMDRSIDDYESRGLQGHLQRGSFNNVRAEEE